MLQKEIVSFNIFFIDVILIIIEAGKQRKGSARQRRTWWTRTGWTGWRWTRTGWRTRIRMGCRVAPIIYRFIDYRLIGTFSRVSVSVKIKLFINRYTWLLYYACACTRAHPYRVLCFLRKNVEEEIAYMAVFCCSGGFLSGSLSNL